MSDSSDGETTKGWALVDQAGQLEDSDDGGSVSSCDVALNQDVVHFRHIPRRSSSAISDSTTPTNLPLGVPAFDHKVPSVPANFRAQQEERDSLTSSIHGSSAAAQSNVNPVPANKVPQGARPKTTNRPPANYTSHDQFLDQSSSSNNSTITSGSKCNDLVQEAANLSPDEDFDEDESMLEDTMTALSDEKVDTSSMSSIEILNISADDWQADGAIKAEDWQGDGMVHGEEAAMQPLLSTSALSIERGNKNQTPSPDHPSSSDTDSEFMRVDQNMAQDLHEINPDIAAIQDNIPQDYGAGAAAMPLNTSHDDQWNDSIHSSASHSESSCPYSMCGDVEPAIFPRRSHSVQDLPIHRHLREESEGEEREEIEDREEPILGPSRRFQGDLDRPYFARRLRRDMSASVSSSASDLSSFSFLGLRAGRQRMNRQQSDDMSEMSSVFTDGSEDLPANMMIGTTQPGPKQYRHKRAERLNSRLNYLVLLVIAFVFTLGIGHYVGSYQEKYYKHQIRQGQVKRLRELQDDLITCLDQTTETDDKKTFSDMVKSLLGDNVKDDTVESSQKVIAEKGREVKGGEEDIDCDSCKEGRNKYSEICNTLCVQGGIWEELDEAISELPLDAGEVGEPEEEGDIPLECIDDDDVIDLGKEDDLKQSENSYDENDDMFTHSSATHDEIPAENTNENLKQDIQDDSSKFPKQDEHVINGETYSYEEAMDIKNKFEKKQDSLEGEEPGFIAEKVIVVPYKEEDIVNIKVQRKQDDLIEEEPGFIAENVIVMPKEGEENSPTENLNKDEDVWVTIEAEKVKETLQGENPPTDNFNEDEDVWVTIEAEKVTGMPPEEKPLTENFDEVEDTLDTIKTEVKGMPPEENSRTVKETLNEDDDTWVSIETEDDENEDKEIIPDVYNSKTVLKDVTEEDSPDDVKDKFIEIPDANDSKTVLEDVKKEDSSVDAEAEFIEVVEQVDDVIDQQTDNDEDDAKIKELQDQLIMAQNRADMWQRKYVEEHHHKPEVIVVEKIDEDVELEDEIEQLKEQLNLAAAHADRWQTLYNEKSSSKHQENLNQEETKKDNGEKQKESDTCGPLGCFVVFENILANFLNSTEGQEFLKFANLTQVLNNATFWEDFAAATNISAYTISDTVYQSWIEFQDYVKTARDHDFIVNFRAVLARAGQSVASAFGSVKNYSSSMGGKAQDAWESVRNFTSDTIDQHNIHLNNISQLKEKVAAAWNTVRNMSSKAVNNSTKKKFSHVIDQAHENLKNFGKSVQDNVKDIGKKVEDNVKDFGKTVHENMQDLGKTVQDNMQDLGKTVHENMKDFGNSVHGTWTSVKDTFGKWHRSRKEYKKHKKGRGGHGDWDHHDIFDSTSEEEDIDKHTRKRAPRDSNGDDEWNRDKMGPRNKGGNGSGKCKGKKCKSNKNKENQTFGPWNKGEKKNGHHKSGKDETSGHGHGKPKNHKKKQDKKYQESNAAFWDVDWDNVLDLFNMNCYGEADCFNHQRRDAAKLYEELTEYKKWLKSHQRKSELKEVRKFMDSLGEFLSDADLDDGDLEELKEDFENVLEKVGRFVQDQRDRNHDNSQGDDTEFNSTVILDFDQMKPEHDNKDDPEKRKFTGYGYQSDDDDDNWFLRRAKDREDHYQDKWPDDDGGDGSWYLKRMQARTDSRTGVTMWDMYQWIRDNFDHRESLRQYDEINWFLKRP